MAANTHSDLISQVYCLLLACEDPNSNEKRRPGAQPEVLPCGCGEAPSPKGTEAEASPSKKELSFPFALGLRLTTTIFSVGLHCRWYADLHNRGKRSDGSNGITERRELSCEGISASMNLEGTGTSALATTCVWAMKPAEKNERRTTSRVDNMQAEAGCVIRGQIQVRSYNVLRKHYRGCDV